MTSIRRIAASLLGKPARSDGVEPSVADLMNTEYDRQTVEVMRRCLNPESICIDGGAHNGRLLMKMCQLAPKAAHHAFEPIPALAKQLRRDFPQARVHQLALSEFTGKSTFKYVRNASGYSGLKERTYDHEAPEIEDIVVDVVRLDDVIPENQSIKLIKLDLEGGEYHAMKGAVNLIRRCKPIIIFEAGEPSSSHYGVTPGMIYSFVTEGLGYSLATMKMWLDNERPFNNETFIENYPLDFYYLACG